MSSIEFCCALAESLSSQARMLPASQRVLGTARWLLDGVVQRHIAHTSDLVVFGMSRGAADSDRGLILPRPPLGRGHICIASAEVAFGAQHVASGVALFDDDGASAAISCVSRATTVSIAPREPIMIGFGGAREPIDHAKARMFLDEDGTPLFSILRALAGSTAMGTSVVPVFPCEPAFDEARSPDAVSVIFSLFARVAKLEVRGEAGARAWDQPRRCVIAESAHDAETWVLTGNAERARLESAAPIDAIPGDACPRCRSPLHDGGASPLIASSIDDLGVVLTRIPLACPACLVTWPSSAVRVDDFVRGERRYEKAQ